MKKALIVALGMMFCVAVPAVAQSYLDKKISSVQTRSGVYEVSSLTNHGHCVGLH